MSGTGTTTPVLEARRLTTCYGRHIGILDVDLTVLPGEVMGLVGANGAGKTTLIRTVLDFVRPTRGQAQVFGLDSVRDSVEVRRRTSYLPGDLALPPRLTGHEVLARFTSARVRPAPSRVKDLADRFSLDLGRRIEDLSKGNKQKVAIVLAFAPRVDLLVLDEPTSGLDPLLQREFAALVAETVGQGATVLLSSHVMSEVEQIATRVALLREGRLATVDTMDALRSQSRRRGSARPVQQRDVAALASALGGCQRVEDVEIVGDAVVFSCSGEIDDVVKVLAEFPIAELDLAHAELEDAFFSAYDAPPESP